MKKNNLIEMLQGCSMRNGMPVSASNPDGEPTVNRQSRLMSYRGYLRNLAVLFAILTLSIGQMWATDVYVWDGNTSETKLSNTSYTKDTDHVDGTTGFVFRLTGWKDGLVDITGYTNYSTYGKSKGIQQGGSNASNNNVKLVIPEGYTASVHVVYALTGSQPKYFGLNATPEVQPDGKNCSAWNVTVTSDKTLQDATIKALKAGTYYLLGNANNCVFAEIKVTLTPSGCTSYSFHYGTHDASDWTIKCFEYSGAGDVYYVNNFIIPDKPNFYVGNQGVFYNSNLGLGWGENKGPSRSVEDAWSNLPFAASQGDGSGTRPKVGAATGAKGKIRVHDTSNWNNMFVAFIPDGYKLKIGSTEYPFTLESGNEFRSDIVELSSSNARSNISVGVIDGSGNYVATANSEGMQHIFLNTGGTTYWSKDGVNNFGLYDDTEGHKYFTCLMTQVPGENNLYEGWVPSNCTKVIFCRLKSSTPEWGEGNSNVYNYTNSLSLLTNQNYWTVTGWNGGNGFWSAYAKKGKFRMYDNSKDKNWYVHFCPYHVLHYDANGGSGAPAADYVSVEETPCQWSLSTTQPTWADHVFLGWSTNSSATVADADAEVADLGKPYGATGDVTLYAVWEACSGPSYTAFTPTGVTDGTHNVGDELGSLSVTATPQNGGALSYQWYQYDDATSKGNATVAAGTNNAATYNIPNNAQCTNRHYYCVISESGCSKTVESAISGALTLTEPVDPCSEPAKVANEIARFFVPCGLSNATSGDPSAWEVTKQDASTEDNTFTTKGFGGSSSNWYRNETSGLIYGKLTSDDSYIILKFESSSFQAGDVVTAYFNRNDAKKTGLTLNTQGSNYAITPAETAAGVETSGSYTLVADAIETDGSIKLFRANSSSFVNRIIVTRTPVAASITATLLTPAYMPTGASGVQIGVEINGAGDGWKYRVKNGSGGYEGPDNTPYTTTTWTMTSTIGAGANTYVVELYDGTGTRQATSNTITVTGETTYPVTITAGANGTVSPSGIVQANGSHIKPEITATPNSGYRFLKWTLNNSNATLADASSATTTITNTTGACEITANFAAAATPIISWDLKVNESWSDVNGTSYDASITGPATSTSNITVTNDNRADKTSKLELSSDGSRYVEFTFEVACGKKLTPDSIVMQVLNVGGSSGGKMTHKAELSDKFGHSINGTVQPESDGTLTKLKVTNGSSVYFQGAVSLKVWAWNHSGTSGTAFRMGKAVKIYGAIDTQSTPSATITWDTHPADGEVGDADATIAAHASDGSTITYTSNNDAVATIVDGKVHYVGAGSTTIQASIKDQCGNTVNQNSNIFTVTAASYTGLSVTKDPSAGSESEPTISSTSVPQGSGVTVTAGAAAAGYVFTGWTSENGTFADATSLSTTFTPSANNAVATATYAAVKTITLKIFNEGHGTGWTIQGKISYPADKPSSITVDGAWTVLTFENVYAVSNIDLAYSGGDWDYLNTSTKITEDACYNWDGTPRSCDISDCITITNFETSQHDSSNNKPDSQGKYIYGYKTTVDAEHAVTITTAKTNNKGQNSNADMLIYHGTSIYIYADNTTTGGTPATYSNVTSISLKIKNNKADKYSRFTIKVGSTTVADKVSLTASNDSYHTHTYSGLAQLNGKIEIKNEGNASSSSTDYNFYVDDIEICTASMDVCTTPTLPADAENSICEADSKPTWNATPTNAAAITAASEDISYSWKKEGSDSELANTASYTPTTLGTYTCTVTVSKTGAMSRTAVMTCTLVINTAPDKPTISGNTTGTVDNNVTLTAATVTAATSYTWYKNDAVIEGATTATYQANETSAGAYSYKVTATNACGTSVPSNVHTVTFSEAVENVKPVIFASQESACTGAKITLTAKTYNPSATLTWYKDGATTGQTGTTYTINSAAAGDAGVYTLKSTLADTEDLTSEGITISINTAPAAFSDFVTEYSVDAEATTVTLNANATGATSYTWYSSAVKNATSGGTMLAEVNTTTYSASLEGVAEGKEYYFYCIAHNSCGNNSAAATTVTVTAVSLEECLDITEAADKSAPSLSGTYVDLSGEAAGLLEVNSVTYLKLGSSSHYVQLAAKTGYTFISATFILLANTDDQKMVYATSADGSSWTYTEYTLSGVKKVRRTLTVTPLAGTKYIAIWRQTDNKGQGSTLYMDPEVCYEMKADCAAPPTFQFEKPASTKITADTYTMGGADYTSPTLNKGSLTGAVTYTSSDTEVATVNSSGVVSPLNAGKTTITATYEGDATYCSATAYYVLTVNCAVPAPEITTTGSSVACATSITLTAQNSSTHAAYTGDAAGGTYEWYRNNELMVGKDGASITVDVAGTYTVVYTKDDCSSLSTNVATVTSDAVDPSTQRLTPFQYYKYNHTYYEVNDPDLPAETDPDIVGPMRHLFKVTPSTLVAGKPCMVKKEIIRADVSRGAASEVTGAYIKYEDNKDGSYNVMLDLNALTTLNKAEEQLVVGDTLILTALPYDPCGAPSTTYAKSIKVYVIDASKHPLAFIVSGATGSGTKKKGNLVLHGDFLSGYNKADLKAQTNQNEVSSTEELPLLTGIKADPKFIVVPVNGYADFNKLNYEPFELLLLTDFVQTDGSNDKTACASIVNDMAELVDYRPILSLKAHMAKANLPKWAEKGFTTLPEVPSSTQTTMDVLCYAHPMFAGVSGTEDLETGLITLTITSGAGYDNGKALQGFRAAGLSGFVFIASIDGGSKGKLYSCIERQNKIDARMVVLSVNGNATSQINDAGQSAIIATLAYLLETDPVKVSDCTVTFDNGDYKENGVLKKREGSGDHLWSNTANWSTGKLPLSNQNIKVDADLNVDGSYSVLSVRLNGDAKLIVNPNGTLSVPGYISKVVGGELTDITETNRVLIQSNETQTGVLIHSQTSGTLAATVQLKSKAYSEKVTVDGVTKKKKYWQYIGLPVQSALAEEAFYGGYTYKYDETAGWIKKRTGDMLQEFWGIGLSSDMDAIGNSPTFTISGNLAYATNRDIELTKTAEAGNGENMIGNSWTAPIHLVNMTDDDFEGAVATIYIFNTGRTDDPNAHGDGANGTAGQWRTIPVGATKLDPWKGPKVIPAMQAFEVDVDDGSSSGTLHLDYDKHVRAIGTAPEENSALMAPQRFQAETPSMMRLRVADSTTYTDLYLIEGEQFTNQFDNGWDGKYQQCDGRSATLYAIGEIGEMAVLAQPSINNTPVVFAPGRDSVYTFTFGYDGDIIYYLNDTKLEKSTEINEDNEYHFTYSEGDLSTRFVISTTPFGAPDITTGIGNAGHPEKVQKIMYKDHIYIIRAGRVYDIVGKEVR